MQMNNQSINQSICQPIINQSTNQPTNQPFIYMRHLLALFHFYSISLIFFFKTTILNSPICSIRFTTPFDSEPRFNAWCTTGQEYIAVQKDAISISMKSFILLSFTHIHTSFSINSINQSINKIDSLSSLSHTIIIITIIASSLSSNS